MSNGGGRVSIPSEVKKVIQNIKEISGNHDDEDVYFLLKECNMDPNETAQKLLQQEKHQSCLSDIPTETKIGSFEQTIHDCPDETKIGSLEQIIDDTVMREDNEEPEEIQKAVEFAEQVQTVHSPEHMEQPYKWDFTNLTYGEYLEISKKIYPPFDYSKAPEPRPVTWNPGRVYIPSDSDSDSESEEAEAVAEQVQTVHSPEHREQPYKWDFNNLTYGEYLEISKKIYPPFDYSKAPEPRPVTWIPRRVYIPSDSDSESGEESESPNEKSPKDMVQFQPSAVFEDDKTSAEPKEKSPCLDFPALSILVKHGVKRSAEGDAGDKDSKRADQMASQTTDEENKGGGNLIFI